MDGEGIAHRRKFPQKSGMIVLDKSLLGIKLRSDMNPCIKAMNFTS